MKYKKIMLILITAIFLASIAGVCAADANDTLVASENTNQIELSDSDKVIEDNLQTSEKNDELTLTDNDVLGADSATYSDLDSEIRASGNVTLTHKNYIYDDGATAITITEDNKVIDGNGAVIDMTGSTIRAFTISTSGVTIKNLTIKNANYNGNGGAIYFSSSGTVTNCNFADNTASQRGCAVYFNSNGNVTNCNFINNTATYYGGAVYFLNTGTVTNCNFADNSANVGGAINSLNWYTAADTCIFKSKSDTININVIIVSPILNVDNFTTFYGSGEKLTFNLTTNSGMPVNNGNISISVYFKNNNTWFGDYSCLSGEGWTVSLPVGSYYAIFDTEYAGFTPVNRTLTVTDGTTFTDLNKAINDNTNDTITLDNDYAFNSTVDGAFTGGIVINRQVTVNGNGHVIDAQGNARAFDVEAGGVVIENLSIKNAKFNGNGGAIYFSHSGSVINCNFTGNEATGWATFGGAVYFGVQGTVSNCNFDGNKAWVGGAVLFYSSESNVINCNFTRNTADISGGAINMNLGTVSNCNFNDNAAGHDGGAAYFSFNADVTNCNFTDNTAGNMGGAASYFGEGSVGNCNFTGNNAVTGSAIYFGGYSKDKILSNSIFLNNRVNADAFGATQNEGNLEITFTGRNNLINAIYSKDDVAFANVTYWGANGITNTDEHYPSMSNSEAGQNITVTGFVNGNIFDAVKTTNAEGKIVLEGVTDYWIAVRHDSDSYYTRAETIISNLYVNVTSASSNSRTVNVTAKSNVFNETMPGKLLFILPNGAEIDATYAAGGIWWAVHTFDDYAVYQVNASYIGLSNVTINNATISITKANSTVELSDIVLNYGEAKNVTVTTDGATGITAKINGTNVSVVNNFTIPISGLNAGTYTLTVTTIADANHNNITRNATITVNKLKTQLSAGAVTTTYNINKNLVITLKDAKGKALSGVKVTVNLNGAKTYTTDKNGQIKVPTKGLVPKAYTAKIAFNGNSNYVKSAKNVKVTVKKATPKLTAKKKTFKAKTKVKKYTITLKNNLGKAIKKAKVTLKVKGKTYKATTNSKGKATFKIKNLKKKGKYTAVIKFKGNKYYKAITKKVKLTVKASKVKKSTFKTVSEGSNDEATVKKIQQALKDHGYYLTYDGHYLMVDGKFESCTERSVREFQHDKGLKVTGKVDEKTAKKLGLI